MRVELASATVEAVMPDRIASGGGPVMRVDIASAAVEAVMPDRIASATVGR